jgi:hypothetical protein
MARLLAFLFAVGFSVGFIEDRQFILPGYTYSVRARRENVPYIACFKGWVCEPS